MISNILSTIHSVATKETETADIRKVIAEKKAAGIDV